MDQACLTIPILPGKTAAARALMRELEEDRKSEYEASQRLLGVTKHVWFLATGPGGDELVAYVECRAFDQAFDLLVRSRLPFDTWFKARLADATGLDLNDPPTGLHPPELLSSYVAWLGE